MARKWFRFGKKQQESTASAVADVEVAPEEPGRPEEVTDAVAPQEATDPTKKRRRRGSRGGRGKKKPAQAGGSPEAPEADAVAAPEKTDGKEPGRGRPERKQ